MSTKLEPDEFELGGFIWRRRDCVESDAGWLLIAVRVREVEHDYVCADCGHLQAEMLQPCGACKSRRVVLLSIIVEHFGEDWRRCFDTPPKSAD